MKKFLECFYWWVCWGVGFEPNSILIQIDKITVGKSGKSVAENVRISESKYTPEIHIEFVKDWEKFKKERKMDHWS